MPNTFKFNYSNNIIILKRDNTTKKFIPHQLHQLPKNYEEIPMSQQFSRNGFCYINSDELNWNADKESRLTCNKAIGGLQSR